MHWQMGRCAFVGGNHDFAARRRRRCSRVIHYAPLARKQTYRGTKEMGCSNMARVSPFLFRVTFCQTHENTERSRDSRFFSTTVPFKKQLFLYPGVLMVFWKDSDIWKEWKWKCSLDVSSTALSTQQRLRLFDG